MLDGTKAEFSFAKSLEKYLILLTTPISRFVFSTSSCSLLTKAIVPSTFPRVSVDSNFVVCVSPVCVVSIRADKFVLVLLIFD